MNLFGHILVFIVTFFALTPFSISQYNEKDSMRGFLSPFRSCFDVISYDLEINLKIEDKFITGSNKISYKVLKSTDALQFDLHENLYIDSIKFRNHHLRYKRKHHSVFVYLDNFSNENQIDTIYFYYKGMPITAKNPPWEGGFNWEKDSLSNPLVSVACEGIGASIWWPNKDHLSDEPDSMRIKITVPDSLFAISNGQLTQIEKVEKNNTFHWKVSYPINNYNVTLYVGKYCHFSDTLISKIDGEKLALDFYVLPYHLQKAKEHFKITKDIIHCFEKYLGKYPFYRDGYGLIETSYAGMEHQSAIAYGNQFLAGYEGRHPEGMPDDFIILHETGHEWWGNSISCKDHAEMWIHESFCTYMESVYMENKYGKSMAENYLRYYNHYIQNIFPILGIQGINFQSKDTDMYYKGAAMLHTLRKSINNDQLWWKVLKRFYQKNILKTISTSDFIDFVSEMINKDLTPFFSQYLTTSQIPILEIQINGKEINYMWKNCVANFEMPIYIESNGKKICLQVNSKPQKINLNYVNIEQLVFPLGLYQYRINNNQIKNAY